MTDIAAVRRYYLILPGGILLYKENHALDAWFNKAYGGE